MITVSSHHQQHQRHVIQIVPSTSKALKRISDIIHILFSSSTHYYPQNHTTDAFTDPLPSITSGFQMTNIKYLYIQQNTLVGLAVHDQSAKTLSTNTFMLVDFLCKAAHLPMFYYSKNVLGSNSNSLKFCIIWNSLTKLHCNSKGKAF